MIVLDTHTWIWLVNGTPSLPSSTRNRLMDEDDLGVSIISCWEIAMLVAKKRVSFNMDVQDWIEGALKYQKIRLLPMEPKIAVLSTRLPGEFHEDPADRLIVASCLNHRAALATKDSKIKKWGFVKIIW